MEHISKEITLSTISAAAASRTDLEINELPSSRRSRRRTLTGLAATAMIAGTIITAATAGTAQAGTSAALTPNVVVRTDDGLVYLPSVANIWTTIISMPVPAGDWVVQAKATAVNNGPPVYIRCRVWVGSQLVGVGSTVELGAGNEVGNLSNIGVRRTAAPVTLLLRCLHHTSGSTIVIEDAALMATQHALIDG